MSAQYGKCNFDGKPVDLQDLDRARPVLAPYGPDGEGVFHKDNVGIIYRAFHTTRESRLENQPCILRSGAILTWDGRLDNRDDLIRQLRDAASTCSTDLSIAAAAYERWEADSFAKLIGDWALSIWDPETQSLILAKDFVGTRHLYYLIEDDHIAWCTIMEPLVLFSRRNFALEEEYIAGWLSLFPASHLTPYVGIHSVAPSSFVSLARGKQKVSKYWDFDPAKRIRYRTDAEYEEHFRSVFSESIRRRLRSDKPVLAELSGGMDSSAIVCTGDLALAHGSGETPRLDTLTYYDDSEPNWNEQPYVTRIERERGRVGWHVDVSSQAWLSTDRSKARFSAIPGSDSQHTKSAKAFVTCLNTHGNRVLLSGIGGDEVAGGVPTPTPELADLLARARFRLLARQLKLWALQKRKPWLHLLLETLRRFLPLGLAGVPQDKRPALWLEPRFIRRHRIAFRGYESRLRLFSSLPSFQENLATIEVLRRQIACSTLPSQPTYEKRYPYLERDLLEFLYAIPRDQVLRPHQRRSLMRRALVGIVPAEILDRKRKAFVARAPMLAVSSEWSSLMQIAECSVCSALGIINPNALIEALQKARHGQEIPVVVLVRTVMLEHWLRHLKQADFCTSIDIAEAPSARRGMSVLAKKAS